MIFQFPKEDITIQGDRFIWSFLSDSSGNHYLELPPTYSSQGQQELWGFRFTVTPIFPEETLQELEQQCDTEYRRQVQISAFWSLAMDHELVSFINEYCDKSRTTSQEFTYDKIDVVDLSVFPLLSELSREKLDHRIKLLKYFNQVMAQMLP